MRSFRIRLMLALIAGITAVSLASTYFEVLAHKHVLRTELVLRTISIANSLQPAIEQSLTTGKVPDIAVPGSMLRSRGEALGFAVYDPRGALVIEDGPSDLFKSLPPGPVKQTVKTGKNASVFGRTDDLRWLEQAIPLHVNGQPAGALVVLEDAGYISSETTAVWRQSFFRTAALVLLIVGVTFLMVRWFLMQPITRLAERIRAASQ